MSYKLLFKKIVFLILFILPSCGFPEVVKNIPNQSESRNNNVLKKNPQVIIVTLYTPNINLEVNKTYDLSSNVILDNNDISTSIVWVSSDPSVATVNSSGKINALKKGTSVIRAVSLLDSNKYAECTVTVKDTEESVPVKIELENTYGSENIPLNTSVKLNGIVKYINGNVDNNLNWSSSDNNIAMVNNQGLVSVINPGKVVITGTSNLDTSVSSYIILNIYKEDDPISYDVVNNVPNGENIPFPNLTVSTVSINEELTTPAKQGENVYLSATVKMSDGSKNKYVSWSTSDLSIAEVASSGIVSTIKEGSVTITATSILDKSKKGTVLLTVQNSPPPVIKVSSVKIEPVNTNIRLGKHLGLSATVTMLDNSTDYDLNWKSNDNTIASINNLGEINTLKEGVVTITATSNKDNTKKDTIVLNIKNNFTWYVNDDATGTSSGDSWVNSFTSFAYALDYSQPGDTIWIASGNYTPNSYFILKSGIKIYGGFAGNETSIEARSAPDSVFLTGVGNKVFVGENISNVTIDGVIIKNGNNYGGDGGAMCIVHSSNFYLSNINFIDNHSNYTGGGLMILSSSRIYVRNAKFKNNDTGEGGSAVGIRDASDISIVDSEMTGNIAGNGKGTIWNSNSSPVLTNISITGNHNNGLNYIVNLNSYPIITNVVASDND